MFEKHDYLVSVGQWTMEIRPRRPVASVAIATPPLTKPQLYILPAVLLAKSGVTVRMPAKALPCGPALRARVFGLIAEGVDASIELCQCCICPTSKAIHVVIKDCGEHLRQYATPASTVAGPLECPGPAASRCGLVHTVEVNGPVPSLEDWLRLRDAVLSFLREGTREAW